LLHPDLDRALVPNARRNATQRNIRARTRSPIPCLIHIHVFTAPAASPQERAALPAVFARLPAGRSRFSVSKARNKGELLNQK
jgi:hypothetical protein